MIKALEQRVINFIDEYGLIEQGNHILLALSGGPDSVFALKFLQKYQAKYKIKLSAFHLNHNLRAEESNKDAVFCSDICNKFNIPFYSGSVNIEEEASKLKGSIEQTAREIRYKLLFENAVKIKADKIITAHNASDNTETVLLNLIKGKGVKAISGIPISRGKIIRPFLILTKNEILNYLNSQNISFRNDESNRNNDYQRNFIRNEILPLIRQNLNPSIDSTILQSSSLLSKQIRMIDLILDSLINKHISKHKNGFKIPLSLNNDFGTDVIVELVKKILLLEFEVEFNFKYGAMIKSLIFNQKGKVITIGSNIEIIREEDFLFILKKEEQNAPKIVIKVGNTEKTPIGILNIEEVPPGTEINMQDISTELVDADKCCGEFELRVWQNADKFIPLGMKKFKNISDFLTDLKIETSDRSRQYLLTNNGKIVWVVNERIDDRFKITNNTKRVYKLCLN